MAATTESTQRTAQLAAVSNYANAGSIDGRDLSGAVQYAFIDVVTTADNAALDVIDLIELPAGAIVIPELSSIRVSDDMTSGALTIDIGDAVDADRYCDGLNAAAAATTLFPFITPTIPDAVGNRHQCVDTGDASTTTTLIKATLATFTATIEAGAFHVILAYKCL